MADAKRCPHCKTATCCDARATEVRELGSLLERTRLDADHAVADYEQLQAALRFGMIDEVDLLDEFEQSRKR